MPPDPPGAPDTTGPDVPVSTTGGPGRNGARGSRPPGRPGPDGAGRPGVDPGGARQERRQVLADADRTHAGAATAVRDAKGLVQVEVADVGAEPPRLGQPHHRVQVGAVDVDLAAG